MRVIRLKHTCALGVLEYHSHGFCIRSVCGPEHLVQQLHP